MLEIGDYRTKKMLYSGGKTIIYEAEEMMSGRIVIVKLLKADYPTPDELKSFYHEFNIAEQLGEAPGIIKVYSIVDYKNSKAIIMEDFGARSLDKLYSGESFDLESKLDIALKITRAIDSMHRHKIIHKDIKPQNILLNRQSGEVKLIDFGLSSRLSREVQEIINPGHLEGTLSYISPEQTGRMNRTIDYRTDFYSLGVTLYELFTGSRPFVSKDPAELVHSHIAITPKSPHKQSGDLPETLSRIIMKLLRKSAEERYQSAAGLLSDLERCKAEYVKRGEIGEFRLGESDRSGIFQIPEKLYGREKEIGELLETFKKCSQGENETLFISGFSGIGKSTLINEIHKPIIEKRGYFSRGKHEKLKMSIPYKAIIEAFREIVKEILTESDESVERWKGRILEALGENARVVIDIIPEVELIVGKQPSVQALGAAEEQNRFNLLFLNFVKVFTGEGLPLVLFIDDLQWADSATLNLLKRILTDNSLKNFLLFGAYRDNEVDITHPFSELLNELKSEGVNYREMRLAPLKVEDIGALLVDTLHSEGADVGELATLIHGKTGGNPFFIKEFLQSLYEKGLLDFDEGWKWDLRRIEEAGITENVIELMGEKLKKLPGATWDLLKIACCWGLTSGVTAITEVAELSEDKVLDSLYEAITEGVIVKSGERLSFVHDKVREAAYLLIDDDERSRLHYKIGSNILSSSEKGEGEDDIFALANQLNLAKKHLDEQERGQLVGINLRAGERARASSAYSAAASFFLNAVDLLPEMCWELDYKTTFNLYSSLAEVNYLSGRYDEAEELFTLLSGRAKGSRDKVKIYSLSIAKDCALSRFGEALEKGGRALKLLGVDFDYSAPENLFVDHMTKVAELLDGRKIESLIELEEMTDEGKIAAMDILNACAIPSYYTVPAFFPIIVMKMIILSLQYGNCPLSAYAYSLWGYTLSGALNDHDTGFEYSNFSVKLADKYNIKSILGKTVYMYSVSAHWKRPLYESLEYGLRANRDLMESGDFNLLGLSYIVNSYIPFFAGKHLLEIKDIYSKTNIALKRLKQKNARIMAFNYTEAVANLLGESGRSTKFKSDEWDDDRIIELYNEEKDMGVIGHYTINKIICCYIFASYKEGQEILRYEAEALAGLFGNPCIPIFHFFHALTLTALYPSATEEEQKPLLEKINSIAESFKSWAEHGSQNYMHKYKLIQAELASITGCPMEEAAALYDEAIAGARENHFTYEEAIANECAARYYLAKGRENFARSYMIEARYGYIKWGSRPKVELLEAGYPELFASLALSAADTADLSLSSISAVSLTGSSGRGGFTTVMLDMNTIMKATRAIAGEIEMKSLLSRFMRIVIENAGAERGSLVLKNTEGALLIEAEAEVGSEDLSILNSTPLDEGGSLSPAIVRYVDKTRETVVLDRAFEEGTFTRDDYVASNRIVSVLCLPVIKQDRVVAILYLENNLSPGSFTPSRVETLRVLSSQAAISIENARMIEHMKERERLRREMELAERIQTSLVPPAPKHDELEIAVAMQPAEEVGGDYYDLIFDGEERLWVAIGDVSGHGMTPGLVMMMAETSLHSNIVRSKGLKPAAVITAVNSVLTENIRERLKEKHFMTMSLLKYGGKGRFTYSGAHLDIIVYRAAEEKVESLKTEGLYLGIMPDLSKVVADREFSLDVGDLFVLYTDGVTESPHEVDKENLFGKERLVALIEQSGGKSATQLLENIKQAALEWCGHRPDDDITLVVIKRES